VRDPFLRDDESGSPRQSHTLKLQRVVQTSVQTALPGALTRRTTVGAVVHFELPYEDRDRAATFYETAFSWQVQKLGPEMGDYVLVTTATSDAKPGAPAGAINGGLFAKQAGGPQHPSIVIGVDDVYASMKKVTEAGGSVLGEPMDIPGVGKYVVFQDPEGNRNSMLQPSMNG
jgi:uncharacterized protein